MILKTITGLRSLWYALSELFAETFHATLQSFVGRRHVGVQLWYTNMGRRKTVKLSEFHFCEEGLSFPLVI